MAKMTKAEYIRRKRRKKKIRKYSILAGMAIIAILVLLLIVKIIGWIFSGSDDGLVTKIAGTPVNTKKLLTVSDNSRPGTPLEQVTQIIIHDYRVPGETAIARRDTYEAQKDVSSKDKDKKLESVHFIIGQDGEIVQCIPINEAAYGALAANANGIHIEYCCSDVHGHMTKEAYVSLVELVSYLCKEFDLKSTSVKKHYDITSKECPYFFVTNTDSWKQFLTDVDFAMNKQQYDLSKNDVIATGSAKTETTPAGDVTPTASPTPDEEATPTPTPKKTKK